MYAANHTIDDDLDRLSASRAALSHPGSSREIKRYLNERVVGQEQMIDAVVDMLRYAQVRKAAIDSGTPAEQLPGQGALLVVSPTGTGKTFVFKNLAGIVDADLTTVDVSSLTGRGWRGLSVDDVLLPLARRQKEDPRRLQIILWDEFDKIGYHAGTQDRTFDPSKDLLKLLDGGTVALSSNAAAGQDEITTADMEGVLHVFAGAFTGIEEIAAKRRGIKRAPGFNSELPSGEKIVQARLELVPEDLERWGIPRELVGRIGCITSLRPLGEEAMREIVKGGEHSMEGKYGRMLAKQGVSFEISDEAASTLARDAVKSGLGARRLGSAIAEAACKAIAAAEDGSATAITLVTHPGEDGVTYELGNTGPRTEPEPSSSFDRAGKAARAAETEEARVLAEAIDEAMGPGDLYRGFETPSNFHSAASILMDSPMSGRLHPEQAPMAADVACAVMMYMFRRYDGDQHTLGNAFLLVDGLSGGGVDRFKALLEEAAQEAKCDGYPESASWYLEAEAKLDALSECDARTRERAIACVRYEMVRCARHENAARNAKNAFGFVGGAIRSFTALPA